MINNNKLIKPFVKWAGGKRQLLAELTQYIPKDYNKGRYFEVFLGGGALLFHLLPKNAVVGDYNDELINVYKTIKENPDELIQTLKEFKNESKFFYDIRDWDRSSSYATLAPINKAARIIYLNKTCYNGLFRVNSHGQFNAPFGNYKSPNIINEPTIRAISSYFNTSNIEFLAGDFEKSLTTIKKNDFVYLDPPYDSNSDPASFTGYTLVGFNRREQERLKNTCDKISKIGAKFLLSNSDTNFIKELYKDYDIKVVQANRSINSIGSDRGAINELLIKNYDI